MASAGGHLASWTGTAARRAIVEFVESTVKDVPPEERIAVFDNDGTLWCEKPMPMGNSNGDVPMLQFAGGPSRPALRLLVLHDDAEREFDYTAGAEQALEQAQAQDWTVVSVKNDWATLGADATGSGR